MFEVLLTAPPAHTLARWHPTLATRTQKLHGSWWIEVTILVSAQGKIKTHMHQSSVLILDVH